MTWLRTKTADKDEAGKLRHAGKASRCGGGPTTSALHQRALLQRVQTKLHPGHDHGTAPAARRSVSCIRVDRRPPAHDHREDETQAAGAGMDVVLMEHRNAAAASSSRCGLPRSAAQRRSSYTDSTSSRDNTRHDAAKKMHSRIHISWLHVLKFPTSEG